MPAIQWWLVYATTDALFCARALAGAILFGSLSSKAVLLVLLPVTIFLMASSGKRTKCLKTQHQESMPRKDSGTWCGPLKTDCGVDCIWYWGKIGNQFYLLFKDDLCKLTWHSAIGKVPEHYKTPGYSKILGQSCFSSNVWLRPPIWITQCRKCITAVCGSQWSRAALALKSWTTRMTAYHRAISPRESPQTIRPIPFRISPWQFVRRIQKELYFRKGTSNNVLARYQAFEIHRAKAIVLRRTEFIDQQSDLG